MLMPRVVVPAAGPDGVAGVAAVLDAAVVVVLLAVAAAAAVPAVVAVAAVGPGIVDSETAAVVAAVVDVVGVVWQPPDATPLKCPQHNNPAIHLTQHRLARPAFVSG
jgi:hypothetical protein